MNYNTDNLVNSIIWLDSSIRRDCPSCACTSIIVDEIRRGLGTEREQRSDSDRTNSDCLGLRKKRLDNSWGRRFDIVAHLVFDIPLTIPSAF